MSFTTAVTAMSMPRFKSIGFMPAATSLRPSFMIEAASTVADAQSPRLPPALEIIDPDPVIAHPLLDCSFALVFAGFLRDLVAPLGEAMLGATVVALDTGPGYYCRDVDRVSGAKVNPHGKGIAIDVSAILLADRRRIAVGREASPQEALFMQTMRRAGCGWFTTILGPGEPDHADHFHFDILRHGATDNYRICE
jgi:hypothetical protein